MTISNVTPTKIYDEDITVSLPRRRNEDGIYKENDQKYCLE